MLRLGEMLSLPRHANLSAKMIWILFWMPVLRNIPRLVMSYYIIYIIYSIIFVLSFVHKLYIWNGVVESHQIRVRAPSSRLLAAERLGSPYSALICACDNRANCSVCARTARKKKKVNHSLRKLLCLFHLNCQWFLSLLYFILFFCRCVLKC